MRRAWARLASPRTAAFTAHVTIHVHEFSPQNSPKTDGHENEIRAANRRTLRKPSILFSLPLGTGRLPVHYFLSEQKEMHILTI